MADVFKVNFAYIKKWEGALSKDPRDPASKFPVPDGSGYHTNMGVTWQAFKAHFPSLGVHEFYAMPEKVWLTIYREGYWNAVKGDWIDSQIIAEFMADWAWGSGAYYPSVALQRYLNSQGYTCIVDGQIGRVTVGLLNQICKAKGEKAVFDALYSARTSFLQSIKGFAVYGVGWMNRMRDFKSYAMTILK